MKFKLDENFGVRTRQLFRDAGHDVETVADEGLSGVADHRLFEACLSEDRCLVTLDKDFSDVTRFSPQMSSGIVVIRVPRNPSLSLLQQLVRQLLAALSKTPIKGSLWIVEVGRIRIHQSEEPAPS